MTGDTDLGGLSKVLRAFATYAARDGAPGYADICARVQHDPELLGLLASAPQSQRRPTLLLAAVHYLLLTGVDSPLADRYPTAAAWRRQGGSLNSDATAPSAQAINQSGAQSWYPAFAELCRLHRRRIEELLATRSTQTNEIGRCSALLPALCTVARRHPSPLAIVDMGCSAGLNLRFDRYAYTYSGPGTRASAPTVVAGDPASPVQVRTTLLSGDLPDLFVPEVAWRSGIDLHPSDPRDDDDALWLLACQWPEHPDRFFRLKAALALARSSPAPPVVTGDLVDDLAQVIATVPSGTHLCLYHTWAAAYLSEGRQLELTRAITRIAMNRPVSWIFAEEPFESPGLPIPDSPDTRPGGGKGATAVILMDVDEDGQRAPWRVADMHAHGRWLRWWGIP